MLTSYNLPKPKTMSSLSAQWQFQGNLHCSLLCQAQTTCSVTALKLIFFCLVFCYFFAYCVQQVPGKVSGTVSHHTGHCYRSLPHPTAQCTTEIRNKCFEKQSGKTQVLKATGTVVAARDKEDVSIFFFEGKDHSAFGGLKKSIKYHCLVSILWQLDGQAG